MTEQQKIENLTKVVTHLLIYLKPKLKEEFPTLIALLKEIEND